MNLNLRMNEVEKHFKSFDLGPISIELEPGKVLALVGPNGSGKTTTLDCISGIQQHDSGIIEVCGFENNPNTKHWKNLFGYVTSEPVFINTMTGLDFLKYISKYYDQWNPDLMYSLIAKLEFPDDERIAKLSTGNKTKLEIISALSVNPKLLLLDEPTNALDPIVRDVFLDVAFDYMKKEENATVWSTHIISEAANIADEFAFLINGKILEISSKTDLTENWRKIVVKSDNIVTRIPDVCEIAKAEDTYEIYTINYPTTIEFLKNKDYKILNEYYLNIENICIKNLQRYKSGMQWSVKC